MCTTPVTIAVAVALIVSGCSSLPGEPAQHLTLLTGIDSNAIPIAEADATETRATRSGVPRAVSNTVVRHRSAGIDPLVILQDRASLQLEIPRAVRIKVARALSLTDPSTTATIPDGSSGRGRRGSRIMTAKR